MTSFAILLVILSTFMHATWNLLARYVKDEQTFFKRINVIIILVGLIPAIFAEFHFGHFPIQVIGLAVLSGLCSGSYYFSLATAYHHGDFTTVYPMSRAIPVILVCLFDVVRGRPPTLIGWVGVVFVVVGCIGAPLQSLKQFSRLHYLNKTGFWIMLTACCTAGYTIFDKIASEKVTVGALTSLRYCYLFFAFSGIVYLLILRFSKQKRPKSNKIGWKKPFIGAICNFGAYWFVVWAYQLSTQAGYIVAFRQFSIIIGVIAAIFLLHEKVSAVRLTSVSIIVSGLLLIGLWG